MSDLSERLDEAAVVLEDFIRTLGQGFDQTMFILTVRQRDKRIDHIFMPNATYMEPEILIAEIAYYLDEQLEEMVGLLSPDRVWTMVPYA